MNTKQPGEAYVTNPVVSIKLAIDRWLKTNAQVSLGLITTLFFVFLVPAFISTAAFFMYIFPNDNPNPTVIAGYTLALLVAVVAVAIPLIIALDYTFVSSQNGMKIGYKAAAKRGYKRLLTAFGAYILALLLIVFGLILFIIPGIYIALRLSYLNSVVANEDLSPVQSLNRAFALSKDNLWDIVGVVSASAILTSVFSIATTGVTALSGDNVFSISLVALLSLLSFAAGLFLIQALYFRYHQSALQKASELTKDSTDRMNYWLLAGAVVATTIDSSLAQSQNPGSSDFQNFNIDDYRGSV